jgi:hypothetical protein
LVFRRRQASFRAGRRLGKNFSEDFLKEIIMNSDLIDGMKKGYGLAWDENRVDGCDALRRRR